MRRSKKGGEKGERNEKGTPRDKNIQKNVSSALEMWRILENPNVKGPSRDIEAFYGEEVAKLAKKGKASIEELLRIQSSKKAKSAMRSFGRLHGGTGVGISTRELEMYDATLKLYVKAWGEEDEKWPDE